MSTYDSTFRSKLLIDIGSSTIKLYEVNKDGLPQILETKSFHFKHGFDPEVGLDEENQDALLDYLKDITVRYPEAVYKTYATAVFRKLQKKARQKLIDKVFDCTGLYFNIISQDQESTCLYKGVLKYYDNDTPTLLINIGGGSTELVIVQKSVVKQTMHIELGVGTMLSEFPGINEIYSKHPLEEVLTFVKGMLPRLGSEVEIAFYTGGELSYMQNSYYELRENRLFEDPKHPSIIHTADFQRRNQEIFSHETLETLESYMPEDPKWMHGARACSAIAQAICEKYTIDTIIPSDVNTVDGVCVQEFDTVVLSGSFRKHSDYIQSVKEYLENTGVHIISPRFHKPVNPGEEFVVFEGEEGLSPIELERYHLDAITQADALVVCCPNGYVGASALIEIGFAQALQKRVIFTEEPEEFMLKTLPSEVGL